MSEHFDDSGPADDGDSEATSTEIGVPGAEDSTLGGYLDVHSRPPAFEGMDGLPYTVSVEIEKTGDLLKPFSGFLVFPRWAETGLGIIGHVETGILCNDRSSDKVRDHLHALGLLEVQTLLNTAIQQEED
jgi:hypothetical protein